MMTFDKLNNTETTAPASGADGELQTSGVAPEAAAGDPGAIAPYVSPDIIPAELPHPVTHGGPLSRGARYMHHFEVELISDGKRLWHVLSDEGQAVVAALFGERQAEQDAIHAAKAAGQ